ncbi:MAG: rod shape-determining protein MreC [Lachnospiraceae bacterium]|nr:rod shape-determining protein MreC [Lachnospiraceae bacterium]
MNRKSNIDIPPKVVLLILSTLSVILIVVSSIFSSTVPVFNTVFSAVVVPMEEGINSIGTFVADRYKNLEEISTLRDENQKLKEKVAELQLEVKNIESDQRELKELRKLYKLDQTYESYETVGARVISTDSSNWYNTFVIDKGAEDGIEVNMNVIADSGLVGIVYNVGKNYSNVRSIIDDTSSVSAMFETTADNCIVNGDLKSIENGFITVSHISKDAKVNEGDVLVTSNVSSRFLSGITIGYISDITIDNNGLTKSGKVTPVVDFKHLQEVLVVTTTKDDGNE